MKAPAGKRGAEQARSLRAPPVVDARIAKDAGKFNAWHRVHIQRSSRRSWMRSCHIPRRRYLF
jgi:hypothetical protein